MDSNLGDAVVSMSQPRNRLENERDKDNEVSRGMWKAVEAGLGKIRVEETERRRSQEGSRKKMGGEEKEKKRKQKKRGQWRLRKWQRNGRFGMKKKRQQDQKKKQRKWCPRNFINR